MTLIFAVYWNSLLFSIGDHFLGNCMINAALEGLVWVSYDLVLEDESHCVCVCHFGEFES